MSITDLKPTLEVEQLIQALKDIELSCKGCKDQTAHVGWVLARAQAALNGRHFDDHVANLRQHTASVPITPSARINELEARLATYEANPDLVDLISAGWLDRGYRLVANETSSGRQWLALREVDEYQFQISTSRGEIPHFNHALDVRAINLVSGEMADLHHVDVALSEVTQNIQFWASRLRAFEKHSHASAKEARI